MIQNKLIRKQTIPVFFASDANYLPYLTIAFKSLVNTANNYDKYEVYILTNDLTEEHLQVLKKYEKPNVTVRLVDVNDKIASIKDKVALRDYYSVSIYFRLFIPTLFPQFKKALYLDSDIIINHDIANLYKTNIGNNFVGAVLDETVFSNKDLIYYTTKALDVTEKQYFNSGVLIMNLDKFRDNDVENHFYDWLLENNKDTVAPDQNYLNIICKNKVKYLELGWDKMPLGEKLEDKDLHLIHFNMFMKPWKYEDTMFGEYFWKVAKETEFYDFLKHKQQTYSDEQKQADIKGTENLIKTALTIADSDYCYTQIQLRKKAEQEAKEQSLESTIEDAIAAISSVFDEPKKATVSTKNKSGKN